MSAMEAESIAWGIQSIRYEIKDIEAPTQIQKAMVLQAESERRKRASILTSEGEKMANINIANAEKQAQILEAEGRAESVIIKAKAQAEALTQINSAINSKGGKEAAQFILGQKYIAAYKKLGRSKNTLVMPTTPNNVEGEIKKSMNILNFKDEKI